MSSSRRTGATTRTCRPLHGDMRTSIMFGRAGNVLTCEELVNWRRKAGLCTTCGITQTHTRSKRRLYVMSMQPITDGHSSYKGHCLRCGGGIARVKQNLGEQPTAEELSEATNSYRGRHCANMQRADRSHGSNTQYRSRYGEGGSSGNGSSTLSKSSGSGGSSGQNAFWTNLNESDQEPRSGGDGSGNSEDDGHPTQSYQQQLSASTATGYQQAAPMEQSDDDSTRPVAERAHRFHIVDTGAFHLRHSDPSVSSCGRTLESLALHSEAMSHTGSILEDERRESRDADHFLGRLNRTNSWDGSMAMQSRSLGGGGGVDSPVRSSARLAKVNEDAEENDAENMPTDSDPSPGESDEAIKSVFQNVAENGDLNDIFSFMAAHNNPQVVTLACRQIRNRAPQEQMALASEMKYGGAGGELVPPTLRRGTTLAVINILPPHWAKSLLSEMEIHTGSGRLLEEIVETIWIIQSLHSRFKSDICDCGGIDAVLNAMRCHPGDGSLQTYGCGLFTSLLSSDVHAAYLRASSGAVFERLLSVTANFDAAASAYALRALLLMCTSNNKTFHEKFQRSGVVDSIVDSLVLHASSSAVQEIGIDLLWAVSDGGRFTIPTPLMLSSSLITSISTAMINYKDKRMILLSALGLLCSVTSGVRKVQGESSTATMISPSLAEDFVDAIICALKNSPVATTSAHSYACRIITNVLRSVESPPRGSTGHINSDGFKALLGEKGAVDVLLKRTLQKPWFDNTLLGDACDALTSMCIDKPCMKEAIISRDGITIAMDIIYANTGLLSNSSKDARQSACLLLSSLAVCAEGIVVLSSPEISNAIIQQLLADGDGNGATSPNPLMLNLLANRCSDERDKGGAVDSFVSILSHISRSSKASVEEAEYCLSLIFSLSGSKECVDVLSMSQGALDTILAWMEAFSDSIVVQRFGLGVLSALYTHTRANDRRIEQNLGSLREIRIILTAIRFHRCHIDFQAEALLCLRNQCTGFAEKIVASGPAVLSTLLDGISDIMDTMKANKDSSVVQVSALSLLWALADLSPSLHPTITSCEGVNEAAKLLNASLSSTEPNEDIQRESLGFLAAVSSTPAAATEMATKEVIGTLLRCFGAFQDEQEQIQRICTLLSSISFTSHEARLSILERHDVFDAISSSIQLHNQCSLVLKDSFALLVNIAIDDVIQRRLYEGGLVHIVGTSLGTFPNDVGLHREACELLWCISRVIPGQEVLECNILGAIIQSASMHKNDAGIQLSCIETLWILAAKGTSNKQEVAFMGGVDVVVTAMKIYKTTSAAIAEKGCVCLWCLAFDPQTCVLIGRRGGIDAVREAMIVNATSAQIQLEALGAIKTLASCSENKAQLQRCHAIGTIVTSMWVHSDNAKIQEAGLMAVTNIAVDPERNEVLAMGECELEAIISAARHFPLSEGLQEQTCVLLRNYTFNGGNIDIMRNNNLVFECLANALDQFPAKCGDRANFIIERLFE